MTGTESRSATPSQEDRQIQTNMKQKEKQKEGKLHILTRTIALGLLYRIFNIIINVAPKPILCIECHTNGHYSLSKAFSASTDSMAQGDVMSAAK